MNEIIYATTQTNSKSYISACGTLSMYIYIYMHYLYGYVCLRIEKDGDRFWWGGVGFALLIPLDYG